jgi:hypothetical protein
MNELTDAAQPMGDSDVPAGSKGRRRSASQWRAWIERQAGSGLSMAAFCREHGLSASGFHQWRRRLRSAATCAGDSSAGFIRLESAGEAGPITVRFGDHVALHCDAAHLERIVALLLRETKGC